MDYMELVKRSINNAWNYKFLWLFGFFVSASDGFGGFNFWKEDINIDKWDHWWHNLDLPDFLPALLVIFIISAFALAIIMWIMSVLSEGALIYGVTRKEFNLPADFSRSWSAGVNKFLHLFGIMLVATLFVIAMIISLLMIVIPSYFAAIGLGIILTIFAIPVLIAVIIIVVCIEGWAIRFAVLYSESWLDAIGKGWQLFKENVPKTLAIAFSSLLSQFVIWCLLIIGMAILSIPFVIMGSINLWLGLLPGLSLAVLIIILSSAFFGTMTSSIWTLGFIQLTGYSPVDRVPDPGISPAVTS